MTSMIFYEKAVALDRARHQGLKVHTRPGHFPFADKANSVFLADSEFPQAAQDYPIVFVGTAGAPFSAVALLGLTANENLLLGADGAWELGAYVPAFVRRYPFVLSGEAGAESLTVCVDEAYQGVGSTAGESLFNLDGSETAYLKSTVEFLRQFHAEMNRTQLFTNKLVELGLLSPRVITVEWEGQKSNMEGLWTVDEPRLQALDDAQTLELARAGYMGLIYAHFLSLNNVVRLARRQDQRRKAAAAELAATPTTDSVH